MRIEAYNQVAQIYGTNKTNRTQATKQTANVSDKVQISQMGKDFQVAKKAVAEASDIRSDKVADIKAKIDAGTYQVSADDFASKLLEKFASVY